MGTLDVHEQGIQDGFVQSRQNIETGPQTDIAEELQRLGGHIEQFSELIESDDERPIGRTLDFLAQEMLREANTIASKSADSGISRLIVEIKGAIDRIKEQVQNVE